MNTEKEIAQQNAAMNAALEWKDKNAQGRKEFAERLAEKTKNALRDHDWEAVNFYDRVCKYIVDLQWEEKTAGA